MKVFASMLSEPTHRMEKWKTRYPHLSAVLDSTADIVAKLREQPDAELEARFGLINSKGRFESGVTRNEIDRIIDMMQNSPHVTGDDEWKEEQDFFFTLNGSQYRTRVNYNSDTMQVSAHTIEKKNIDTQTFRVIRPDGSGHDTDVRVSLKSEATVLRLQPCVNTDMVRIKQRRRFVTSCGKWAFDFSIIWSGKDKTSAEIAQSTRDPMFEVECELLDPQKTLATQSNDRIACSILLKMYDLISHEECTLQPLLECETNASRTSEHQRVEPR